MKTQSITNIRLVEDKQRLLLNFVFSLWFEKELEKVNAGTSEKRKKRYAQLDPFKMVIEPPVVFKDEYFYACATDRPGGTLLVDKQVPYLTLETFLEKAKLSDKINQDGNFNQTLADAVKNKTVTLKLLSELIASSDNLSTDPIYYLAQIKEENSETETGDEEASTQAETTAEEETDTSSGEYVVIFDSKTEAPDFNALVSWIFRDYTFEEIAFESIEEGDSNYPTKKPDGSDANAFSTGTVTLKDSAFKEKTFTFNFIDLKLLASIADDEDGDGGNDNGGDGNGGDTGGDGGTDGGGNGGDGGNDNDEPIETGDAYVSAVTPNTTYDVIDPTMNPALIGKNTRIALTKRVDPTRIKLTGATNDLGEDILKNTTLEDLKLNEKSNASCYFSVTDLAHAFAFKYPAGYRRSITTLIAIPDSRDPGKQSDILFDYQYEENSITPVIENIDISNGLNKVQLDLSFLDKSGTPIDKVVPQTLSYKYAMFDENGTVKFNDYQTDYGTKDGSKATNILSFGISVGEYGTTTLAFVDPAIKSIQLAIVDPTKTLNVKLVKQAYASGKLSLTYNVVQDNDTFNSDDKSFTVSGAPVLVINDSKYEPTTEWNDIGFTNTYDIGEGVDTENITLEGQLKVGANNVIVNFTDTIDIGESDTSKITATFLDFVFSPTIKAPDGDYVTEGVGDNSLILVSESNQVKTTDLEVVNVTDGLGEDITDKMTYVFSSLNEDKTQFTVSMTFNGYRWPMSFDNQGSSGDISVTIGIKDRSDITITRKATYKLEYQAEAITPRVINAQLTNNSLNNAKIFVAFYDNNYNSFETGIPQDISINPPLFANSELTYIGNSIQYGEDDDNHFGAFIPVNFAKFGNFNLAFADTRFKSVTGSVADPTATYTLTYVDDKFVDSGDLAVRFRLKQNGTAVQMYDGKVIDNSVKVAINSQSATIGGLGWEGNNADGALLTVYVTLADDVDKNNFDIDVTGQWYIGANNVTVNLDYSASNAEV